MPQSSCTLLSRIGMYSRTAIALQPIDLAYSTQVLSSGFCRMRLPFCIYESDHILDLSFLQICTATSRVFVHEKIYDSFMNAFVEYATKVSVIGNPFDGNTSQGAKVSEQQFDKNPSIRSCCKERRRNYCFWRYSRREQT